MAQKIAGIVLLLVLARPAFGAPPSPQNFHASAMSPSRIELAWISSNVTGFVIERMRTGETAFSLLQTVSGTARTYQDVGLWAETGYMYRIKAYKGNAGNASPYAVTPGGYVFTFTLPAPVVNAGIDQTINVPPGVAQLTATVVTDGLRPTDKVSYQWTVVSGPPSFALISSPNALQTQVNYSAPGVYVMRMTATITTPSGATLSGH